MAASKGRPKAKKATPAGLPEQNWPLAQILERLQEASRTFDFPDMDDSRDLIEAVLSFDGSEEEPFAEARQDLVEALSELRLEAGSGNRWAQEEADELRRWLVARLAQSQDNPGNLFMLAAALGEAGFDPGEAFVAEFGRCLQDFPTEAFAGALRETLLSGLLEDVEDDAFGLHGILSHFVRYLPGVWRQAILADLATVDHALMQEALLGFLLEGSEEEAAIVCDGLVACARKRAPSGRILSRLVLLSSLLGGALRRRADAAAEAIRPLVTPFEPESPAPVTLLLASLPDAGGSQMLGLHQGKGRDGSDVTILLRAGQGVAEIINFDGMSKRQFEAMFFSSGVRGTPVTLDSFVDQVGARLAENRASGTPIPFSLVALMERTGLASFDIRPLQPQAVFDAVTRRSLLDISSPQTLEAAFKGMSAAGIGNGWCESNQEIAALLKKGRSRKQRVQALLEHYLPMRKDHWARQCAWSVMALDAEPAKKKQSASKQLALWLAVLGAQLCSDAAPADSPLLRAIAEETVTCFLEQSS